MRGSILAGLASSLALVSAHPGGHAHGIAGRGIDINVFRLKATSQYVNATVAETPSAARRNRRGDYVGAATNLVESLKNGTTYRVVGDHYVGANGIAHVNFKQTANGLDIDNGDMNVNVSATRSVYRATTNREQVAPDGTIFSYGNSFFSGSIPSNPLTKRDFSDPVDALKTATNMLALPIDAENASAESAEGKETFVFKDTSGAVQDPKAKLVYLNKDGNLVLTWRVETDIMSNWLLTYVDAATNEEIHGVVDYSADATYQVL
jgi:extracellular elastinolytic metalloproteinase